MKAAMRRKILEERNKLSKEIVEEKSKMIFKQLKDALFYQNATKIMLYIAFRNEVLTHSIIEDIFTQSKRVFIPVTVPKTKELIVSELLDPEKDLEIGHFGVLEPKMESIRKTNPQILDLIIVPGVCFDMRGYRIGYGGGYYDRFLPRISPHVPTVSLAFELQMVDRIPNDPFDFPVQFIITENRIISCKQKNFS